MRIPSIAFLLSLSCFAACQQGQEQAVPVAAANLAIHTNAVTYWGAAASSKSVANLIFQSTDGGQTWQDISAGLPEDKSLDCFSVQNGEAFLSNNLGLYRSKINPTGFAWQKEFMLRGPVHDVTAGQLGSYAFCGQNGFYQNIAQGTWMPVTFPLKGQYFRTIFEAKDGTVFIGTDNGIFKSADHGNTWKHVHQDGWMIKMVESDGVLICTNERGILRSTDGGEHWNLVVSEGGVGIEAAVIKDGFAVITYNTTSKTRRIRMSTDGGKTWKPIDANLPPDASIASIKQVGEYFFCGHPKGIYRSDDQGKTWELVLPSVEDKVFNLLVSGNVIYAVPRNKGC